ncbi:MAG: DUF4176 domain-containing protein [Lachnotalea sp.]
MEEKRFLPLGTIVIMKGSVKKAMLIARGALTLVEGKQKYYDYGACTYPEGVLGDSIFYFNHEDIQSVIYKGYVDEDDERMIKNLEESVAQLSEEYKA